MSSRFTFAGLLGLALAIACGGGGPTKVTTVTPENLDALPKLTIMPGTPICLSGTPADTGCPLSVATGNWLGTDRYAVWEMGRPVQVWSAGKRSVLLSSDTAAENRYLSATAVGPGKSKDEVLVVDAIVGVTHTFRLDGTHVGVDPLPMISELSIWGYYGALPVWQRMVTASDSLTADVVVRVGKTLGDTAAREAFRANLPWLHLQGGSVTAAPPLFPNSVLYAFATNGDVIWSDATHFVVERDRPNGKAVWKITSDISGPPVDSVDIAQKRAELSVAQGIVLEKAMIDSMVARTIGMKHPALNGILMSPSGQTLIARTVLPQRDSVDYIRLNADGVPSDRFTLPKKTQMVLFGGDSILVHYSPEGEGKRLVWMRLAK